jgi:two-component system, chemotaxis family, sensor kinase Cph1
MQPDLSAREIKMLRASLDSSERETQRFLEHVVHDIRTARRAVGISAEVLLEQLGPLPSAELKATARHMQDGLAKMDAILSGVSSYCLSLRASAYSFNVLPAEMAVRLALRSLEGDVRETGAVITCGHLPKVVGDRDRLTTLFRQLIDNALKYRGPAAPQIEIRAQQDQDIWLFSVRDNGIGIDRQYWDGIFEPFSRLHGSEIPGVGLGLAVCRKILDAHRGTIRIESTVGSGTTFFFTIPAEHTAGPPAMDLNVI